MGTTSVWPDKIIPPSLSGPKVAKIFAFPSASDDISHLAPYDFK